MDLEQDYIENIEKAEVSPHLSELLVFLFGDVINLDCQRYQLFYFVDAPPHVQFAHHLPD